MVRLKSFLHNFSFNFHLLRLYRLVRSDNRLIYVVLMRFTLNGVKVTIIDTIFQRMGKTDSPKYLWASILSLRFGVERLDLIVIAGTEILQNASQLLSYSLAPPWWHSTVNDDKIKIVLGYFAQNLMLYPDQLPFHIHWHTKLWDWVYYEVAHESLNHGKKTLPWAQGFPFFCPFHWVWYEPRHLSGKEKKMNLWGADWLRMFLSAKNKIAGSSALVVVPIGRPKDSQRAAECNFQAIWKAIAVFTCTNVAERE